MSLYNLLKKWDGHLTMKFKIILLFLLYICLINVVSADWVSNSSIVYGLGNIGIEDESNPTIFNDSGTLKAISGHAGGYFVGWQWNGSSWTLNSSIITGLGDIGLNSRPSVYNNNGTFKLISSRFTGSLVGWQWNGTSWISNSSIVNGISTQQYNHVYNDSGTLKLILNNHDGTIKYSYNWNGTSWVSNSSIINGLTFPSRSDITIYKKNGVLICIIGASFNNYYGWQWNGTSWISNSSIVNGINTWNYCPTPFVYNDSGTFKLISGRHYGDFRGYQWNEIPITSDLYTESQTNSTKIYTNTSTPYFNWTYSDVDSDTQYSWEIQVGTASGLSDMWDSGQLLGADTSDIYAGSTLIRNTTYYVQVRTNDRYETSSWETGTFKINALPVITNIVITPEAPLDTDDLTATNDTATDGNGDSITIYHRWYKDDVLQPALNYIVTINSSNTTDDEVWKVGIIPNDSYENGTETFSGTVTIGSGNYVPTLSSISSNLTLRKYNKSVTITTSNAFDQNNDNYTLHIGSSSGTSDLCNSSITINGTEASCNFIIPWTSGAHTIYGRLTDQNDTSIEYTEVISVDVTPPSIDSSSVSPASGTTDLTYQLSASISIANGSISSVNVCVGQVGLSCTNYTMVLSGANYIYNFSTGSAGSYVSTIYTTDDSGNSNSATGPSFTISTGSQGGGGGGATNITINETIIGDLTLTPPRLDTYAILLGDSMTSTYRFVANRHIESCDSEVGECSITAGYIVNVAYEINQSTKYIEDNITVRDVDGYLAVSKVQYIRVIHLGSSIPIGEIHVGESLGNFLSVFFEVSAGILTGIKTWFLVSLVGALGYFGYKSYQ